MDDNHVKDKRDIKRSLELEYDNEFGVHVFAIAVAKDPCLNKSLQIPTAPGEPLCAETHDFVRDCYYVDGVDWHEIGEVFTSFRLAMKGVCGWEQDIPVPGPLLQRHLSEEQKKELNAWKSSYSNQSYKVEFFQVKCVY